jgi:hydroxymethylpyrimidine pyrophosphatase-like HAD family hydrolase
MRVLLYFHNAIRKYNNDIKWEILEEHNSNNRKDLIDKLNEREIFLIESLKTLYPDGYNLTIGGGNYQEGLGKYRKGKTFEEIFGEKEAQEIKKRMSKGIKGKTKGRKCSSEEVKRRSLSNTGKKRTEETKEQTRQAMLGIKHTEERRKNISEALKKSKKNKGKNNPQYRHLTGQEKDKIMDLHVNKGFGSRTIEKETGISFRKVLKFLREEGLYTHKYKNHK